MAELTKEEKAWVKKVNALLAKCPSDRIGFYTIGDPTVFLYDLTHEEEICSEQGDLIHILQREGWGFDEELYFPAAVEGVCG